MPSLKVRVTGWVAEARQRRPLLDHVVRMQEHYGAVKAGQQAGAVTYFAFLSFFPILALAFFVVGWIAKYYTSARTDLVDAINAVMPGLLGGEQGQTTLDQIEKYAATLGVVGAIVLLYSGLGWLAAMRSALLVVFEVPLKDQPNFVIGKVRDLITLGLIGVILLISVALAGLIGGYSGAVLGWLGLGDELYWLVTLLTVVLGLAANMLLFYAMFVLLAGPHTPRRSLWSGALLGALAFEVLKQISGRLISATQGSPAFQAFGIALIVLIWINYFSRVVLYSASWAHTSVAARALRPEPQPAPVEGPPSPPLESREVEQAWATPYLAGAVTMLGLTAVVRKLSRKGL